MPKTRLDVIARAHRVLGVLAVDEAPTADMVDYAGDTLDTLLEELTYSQNVFIDADDVDDAAFVPLADLLASEISLHYGVNGPLRSRAITRLRAYMIQDDR